MVGVEDADAADEGVQGSGQGDVGDVAVGAGGGAADDYSSRGGAEGHGGVLGLAQADFVDEDDDLSLVVQRAGCDGDRWAEAEGARVIDLRNGEGGKGRGRGDQGGAEGEGHEGGGVVANVDDEAPGVFGALHVAGHVGGLDGGKLEVGNVG